MTVTTDQAAPRRIKRAQVLSLALLILSGVVNYMDRGTLSVANSTITQELGITLGQMGWLLSAFSWSYALSQLPAGGLVDRIGPRKLLTAGLVVWSLAQAAGGLVTGYTQFILSRIVLGVGEAPQFPSAARVVSNWYPLNARGKPTGVFNAASPLGSALAPPLLTLLMLYFDWRTMFILMGAAGLIVAVIWYSLYRDPTSLALDANEQAYLASASIAGKKKVTFGEWRGLFAHVTTWGMIVGYFGSVYLNWVYLTWLPSYLTKERHMSLTATGYAAFVPFFCGFIGCLVAGWFSDRVAKGSTSLVTRRKIPVVIAMLGMAVFTVPAALVQNNTLAIACISVAIFLANAASVCSWTLVTAVAPANRIASLGSLQNFGGFLGSAMAPILTGYIAEYFSFGPALITGAAISFLGALSYLFLVRRPIDDSSADLALAQASMAD
jgi:sugar phosphate permease